MTRFRRRNKLPKPSLQIRLTLMSMGTLALSILLQLMLTRAHMLRIAVELPHDGARLLDAINGVQLSIVLACFLVLMPVCFAVGVLSTFRVAGPIYRFEEHLRRLARGEDPGPCRLRKGDQLQDFCALLNAATEPLRQRNAERHAASTPKDAPADSPPSLARDAREPADPEPHDARS